MKKKNILACLIVLSLSHIASASGTGGDMPDLQEASPGRGRLLAAAKPSRIHARSSGKENRDAAEAVTPVQESTEITVRYAKPRTPFWYQVNRHYKELVIQLQEYSERDFQALIHRILATLETETDFFRKAQSTLVSSMGKILFNWLESEEGPISRSRWYEECTLVHEDEEGSSDCSADYYDLYDEEDSDFSEDDIACHDAPQEREEDQWEREEEEFQSWQLRRINELFGVYPDSLEDFRDEIGPEEVERFAQEHVEGGYSWLVNEQIEGDLEISQDFARKFTAQIRAPETLIASVFGGLWFYFDWEEFQISSATFVRDTYVSTLRNFLNGGYEDSRRIAVQSLYQSFFHNREDFEGTFAQIQRSYNKCVREKDWRNALVMWSLYSAYQKIFNPAQVFAQKPVCALSPIKKLNKKNTY